MERSSGDTVEWDAITTGNFGGFDVWLNEGQAGQLDLTTNRGTIRKTLADFGLDDTVLEAGVLELHLCVFRLPDENPHREVVHELRLSLKL